MDKGYWFINTASHEPIMFVEGEPYQSDLEIGNYFETKEEAEDALEKLKAWNRLKKLEYLIKTHFRQAKKGEEVEFKVHSENEQTLKDLHTLFGGEE